MHHRQSNSTGQTEGIRQHKIGHSTLNISHEPPRPVIASLHTQSRNLMSPRLTSASSTAASRRLISMMSSFPFQNKRFALKILQKPYERITSCNEIDRKNVSWSNVSKIKCLVTHFVFTRMPVALSAEANVSKIECLARHCFCSRECQDNSRHQQQTSRPLPREGLPIIVME